ncbi:hypothetical protein DEI81_02055 [Curtobacterium sp. MCBD17_013]|uniref:hypothetical protein n=1 Tax=unclassified Curtobacterium TaxID=257496 RepID=UPI000DAA8C5B|nr:MULTISPECIES: hypothetical protein [unclassified Curtobacterium]PZE75787.1 hypothetical protein DEI82_07755 [Curtobacterium sp. MCBD17_019]PZF66412.1 hypothetical protein DEI81_02055 [Curtobacterium sp. MCBD17_013]WIE56010.1 hypothetical protein DEI88_007405 [Curtobacterium sp. MCBD17_003]
MVNDRGGMNEGAASVGASLQHEASESGDRHMDQHPEQMGRAEDGSSGLDREDRGEQEQSALAALGDDARGGDAMVGAADAAGDASSGTQQDDQEAPGGDRADGADVP